MRSCHASRAEGKPCCGQRAFWRVSREAPPQAAPVRLLGGNAEFAGDRARRRRVGSGSPPTAAGGKLPPRRRLAARRKRRVPPMIRQPIVSRSASSRAASAPRRTLIAAVQSGSASACPPIAIAGPLTGQGPRRRARPLRCPARRSRSRAEALQVRRPCRTSAGRLRPSRQDRSEALAGPSKSAKASSTMSEPPRRASRSCKSRRSARARDPAVRIVRIDDDRDVELAPESSSRFASTSRTPAAAKASA